MSTQIITAEIVTDDTTITTAAVEIDAINRFHRAATAKADQARTLAQEASHYALLCGTRLESLKASLPHGEWEKLFSGRKNLTSKAAQIGECAAFEFSVDTARRYIEVAKRIRLEQKLSGKAQQRLSTIASEPEIDDESRAWLDKLTEGRNLRQLYLDLDIISAPEKPGKDKTPPTPPPGSGKTEAQSRLEDAREHWFTWREQGEKLVRIGCLDHLDKKGLEEMKEFQGWLRDRINARLNNL